MIISAPKIIITQWNRSLLNYLTGQTNLTETEGIERGPTHQEAIDVWNLQKFFRVVGLYTATIKDCNILGATLLNNELELQLKAEKDAHAANLAELQALKAQDAAAETVAAKAADKQPDGNSNTVYSHDRLADDFLS